jgi:hypothetical protein
MRGAALIADRNTFFTELILSLLNSSERICRHIWSGLDQILRDKLH